MTDWKILASPQIKDFIVEHENDDVRALALKKPPNPEWPYSLILDQIKARQKARVKMPDWLAHEDVVFPTSDIIEQASSTATARYKTRLVKGQSFVDLTGGAGVDAWAMFSNFDEGVIVDHNEDAAARLAHNMPILVDKFCAVYHQSAEEYVRDMPFVDCVMIDPQRRNQSRKGLYVFEECSPNIVALLPMLKSKAGRVVVKTSPMLDINQGIAQLGNVSAVHVLEWRGECKEVVYLLDFAAEHADIPVTAVQLSDDGKTLSEITFTREDEKNLDIQITEPQKYLYEPSPACMKAGGFKTIAARYDLSKLHAHTHLYTSRDYHADFPGRAFEIHGIYPVQAKGLPFEKANLTVRNFPLGVEALRKKLKLKDGGDDTLFACTIMGDRHVLIHGRKAFS